MVSLFTAVVGIGLLLAGRKIFWLFVGGIGFLIGIELARRIAFPSDWMIIIAALGLGLIFALLAVFLESVAIGIAGFLGGGLAAIRIAALFGMEAPVAQPVLFVVGGILGALLIVVLLNWALITISSIAGASMVASSLPMAGAQRPIVLLLLIVLGVVVQSVAMRREGSPPETKP